MDGRPYRVSCEDDICWVCLEGSCGFTGSLEHPCACPRGVHAKCLARWQLQSAGREEERYCRFCKSELPDWRDILTPKVPAAAPVMAIVYDGKVIRLQVKPGPEGMIEFQRQVRHAFNLGEDVELDCVFDCRAPGTGEKIKLRGLESYSAAMHCAAVAAGERIAKQKVGLGNSENKHSAKDTSKSSSAATAVGNDDNSNSRSKGSSSWTSRTSSRNNHGHGGGGRVNPSSAAVTPIGASLSGLVPQVGGSSASGPSMTSSPLNVASASRELRTTTFAAATMTADVTSNPLNSRTPSDQSLDFDTAAAACHFPGTRSPRYCLAEICSPAAMAAVSPHPITRSPSAGTTTQPLQLQPLQPQGVDRRRKLFMGFVRGLGAMRRVL